MTVKAPQLILASASPRRRAILDELGIGFRSVAQQIDESPLPNETGEALARRLARQKAEAALAGQDVQNILPVLGADTVVLCENNIFGKPADKNDALAMLEYLSGKTHQVLTAVTVMDSEQSHDALSVTSVRFRILTREEIRAYWLSGEPSGKAGAYAIQGLGAMFVAEIDGSFSGVVGLPVFETVNLLEKFGLGPLEIFLNRKL